MPLSEGWKEKWLDKLIYGILIGAFGYVFWKYPPVKNAAISIIDAAGFVFKKLATTFGIHL
jgi:hypothetical protein